MRQERRSGHKANVSLAVEPQTHRSVIRRLCLRILPLHHLRRIATTQTTRAEAHISSGNVAPARKGTPENNSTRITQPVDHEPLPSDAQPGAALQDFETPRATQTKSNFNRIAKSDPESSSQEPDGQSENDETATVPSLLDSIKSLKTSLDDSEMATLRLKCRVIQLNKPVTTLLGDGKDFIKIQCLLRGRQGPEETYVEERAWQSVDTEERREQGRMYWLTEDDMPHILWGDEDNGEDEVDRQNRFGRVVGSGVDRGETLGSAVGESGYKGVNEQGTVWREGEYWMRQSSRELDMRDRWTVWA